MSAPTAKLLLVDDVEANLLVLSGILRRDGVELLTARSGREALELLLVHDVALAIIDVQMPLMDGFELAELMRGAQRTRGVPIIFLTAGAQDYQRRFRGYEAGAVDFLYKPLEPDILRSKADVFLDLCAQRQEIARQRDDLRALVDEKNRLLQERQQAQEALQELNRELEARISERTAELRRSLAEREKLQDQVLQGQKMESIGTLASGIAHDFNNLLNIISGYAAIMRMDGKNPAAIAEGVAVIEETVKRGAALVRQLLAVGRKGESNIQSLSLNRVIENLKALLTETFSKTITITLDLERGLPAINGDENQLRQSLLNLCVNARDAMPQGGRISLKTETVSGEELRRRIPEVAAASYVSIRVTDTGSGIDEATQQRIFEPFFTTKPPEQGTGLGLAVVYGIVKKHAGFVEVDSQIGRGTTFSIYLPVPDTAAEPTAEASPSDAAPKPRKRGETILFVDDEERQLSLMRKLLEREGYKVLTAMDGVEAVEVFKRHKDEITLAVLDLGLPKLGGWQAFQQMREINPNLKALVASGFVPEELEAEIAHEKLGGILMKPYLLDDVLKNISAATKPS